MARIRSGRTLRAAGLVLAALLAAPARSAPPPGVVVTIDDVRFQRHGVEDGLSQSSAMALLQDAAGYVWIGTQDGLNRFDGYDFKVYRNDPRDAGSVPDNFVPVLEPARQGGFWVGTVAGGLGRYVPAQDRFVRWRASRAPGGLATNSISALRELPGGRLWVAGNTGELQWLDPGATRFESVPPAVSATLGTVVQIEPFGDALLVAAQTGLWRLERDGQRVSRWTPTDGPQDVETIEFLPDGGDVWVGTRREGLFRFGRDGRLLGQWRTAQGLPDDQVRDLQFDQDGHLWIATFDGLARLDGPSAPLRVWRFGAGLAGTLASSRVHRLMLDRDGLLWVGTWLNGFSVHVPHTRPFAEIKVQHAGARGGFGIAVSSVHVDRDGSLWLGAAEDVSLLHYDLEHGLLASYRHEPGNPRSLPTRRSTHMLRDRQGRLWVATTAGLARLDGDGFVTYRHDPKDPGTLPDDAVRRLYEDSAGTLWAGTYDGGLAALCATCTKFRRYPIVAGRPVRGGDNSVEALFEDSRGNFWAGGLLGGLLRIDRDTGRVERFRARPGEAGHLSHDTITAVVEDRRGRLWVGTQGGGLNRMELDARNHPRFTVFDIQDGLPTNAIGGIVEDGDGQLWASTTAGISRIDPDTGEIVNYGPGAGTQPTGYFIGAFEQLRDGRILFGGLRGVTLFDPRDVRPLPSPHRVAITDLRVHGFEARAGAANPARRAAWTDAGGVRLPPDGDDISIGFSALAHADPASLHYAYRLEGVNDDWVEVDARRRVASYSNLPPGRYTFHARARNPHDEWGPTLSVPIELAAPWWRTAWATLAYVVVAALAALGLAWAMRQRMAERERARRVIADSEQRLTLALWGTGDELWELDLVRNELRRQNPLSEFVAMGNEELVGDASAMRAMVHPDDLAAFDEAIRAHLTGQAAYMELAYRVLDREDRWRWLLSRGRVVERDAEGHAVRIAGTNSDITRLKEGELALERINAELESRVQLRTEALNETNANLRQTIHALREAQQQLVEAEKMAALGGLVAGVAHEINTPLGVGVTAASHLEEEARRLALQIDAGTLDRDALERFRRTAQESTQLILANLRRADRMVKSFRQVAVDQSSEELRRIEVCGYLEDVLLSLRPSLRQRRHAVEVQCAEPVELETYPGAIYQIVSNLVMNSLLHGFGDRDQGRMRIRVAPEGEDVVLRYEDDGAGMDEEVRRRVFEPFFTTRRGAGGSGLGLHIAWNLATQLLGGSLTADPAPPGEGARFTLRIPRKPPRR